MAAEEYVSVTTFREFKGGLSTQLSGIEGDVKSIIHLLRGSDQHMGMQMQLQVLKMKIKEIEQALDKKERRTWEVFKMLLPWIITTLVASAFGWEILK